MRSLTKAKNNKFNLNFVLEGTSSGLVDGTICALGVVIGVSAATNDAFLTIISGIIAGFSNSFGNSIGFYLSQVSERNIQIVNRRMGKVQHVHSKNEILLNAIFSFLSTFFVNLVILSPFLALSTEFAIVMSVILSVAIVFALGAYNAKITRKNLVREGVFYSILTVIGAIMSYAVGVMLYWII